MSYSEIEYSKVKWLNCLITWIRYNCLCTEEVNRLDFISFMYLEFEANTRGSRMFVPGWSKQLADARGITVEELLCVGVTKKVKD